MNRYYIVPIGTTVLCSTVVPTGTMVVPTGTMVLQGTTGYYRVLRYYKRVLCSTHGYYVVPKTGYYRVLQSYAAEGMRRVRVRVRLRALELSKYCNVSKNNSNKMARAFAEGVKCK